MRARRASLRARRGARRARARRGRAGRSTASPATSSSAPLRAAVPVHPERRLRPRATPCCPPTSSAPTTAPASCTPRSRSARTTTGSAPSRGSNVVNPVRLDGTYDERIGPYAGRWVKDADPDLIEDLRERGRLLHAERVPARLPALLALRHAAALLRQAVVVHPHVAAARPAAGRQRDGRAGTRRTSSTGASASGSRTTSTGRSRASATGARRCRCGAAPTGTPSASARSASSSELSGRRSRTRTGPTSTTPTWDCAECGEPMQRVPEVIDVWFDSGSMPFAQHHAPFENEDVFEQRFPPTSSARRSTRRAAGSTRCSRSRRCCSTRRRTERARPGPHPRPERARRCRSRSATSSSRGTSSTPRRRRVPLVLPDLQAAVGRLPVLHRHGRRVGAPVAAPALEHLRLLRRCTRTSTTSVRATAGRAGHRPRPWILAARRTIAAVARPARRLRRHARRPRDRGVRRRPLQLVRAAPRAGASGSGDPAAFATLHDCLVTVAELLAPFTPFVADEIYDNLDGHRAERAPQRLPRAGRARRAARVRHGGRARDGRPRAAARGQAKLKVRQPLRAAVVVAATASAPRSTASATSCARRSSTSRRSRYVAEAEELGSYEVKPNYRTLGPRFGKLMPQVAPKRSKRSIPRTWRRRCARRAGRGQRRRPRPRPGARTCRWS